MLESLISSKTRLRILIKFFVNITNQSYLNSLANEFGESTNSVRKELNNLSGAGYLSKENVDNKVVYKANRKHPLFSTLQKIIREHLGIELILENILKNIGDYDNILLLGDYAKGIDSGCIEVLIVGKNINQAYLSGLKKKIEKKISRNVIFLISNEIPTKDYLILV